jgi:hypothetical protein
MDSVNLAGTISILLQLLAAFLLILNFREGRYSFLALAFNLLQIVFIDLISTKVININELTTFYLGTCNNLLDAPLMLVFMLYFTKTEKTKKLIIISLGALVLFDLIAYLILGLTNKFLTLVIGPGLFVVTAFAFYFFVEQLKAAMYHKKEVGKAFISGGIVFTYLCFLFIYVMFYVLNSQHLMDIYMIYHITFMVLALSLIIGIAIIMRTRLLKPKPIQRSRKEDPNAFQYL